MSWLVDVAVVVEHLVTGAPPLVVVVPYFVLDALVVEHTGPVATLEQGHIVKVAAKVVEYIVLVETLELQHIVLDVAVVLSALSLFPSAPENYGKIKCEKITP